MMILGLALLISAIGLLVVPFAVRFVEWWWNKVDDWFDR